MKSLKKDYPIYFFVGLCICLIGAICTMGCKHSFFVNAKIMSIDGDSQVTSIPDVLPATGVIKVECFKVLLEATDKHKQEVIDRTFEIPVELLKDFKGQAILPLRLKIDLDTKVVVYYLNDTMIYQATTDTVFVERGLEALERVVEAIIENNKK